MKTGHEIESDIFGFLKGSALTADLDGGLYRSGTRPRDSKAEDLVVIFTSSDAEQVQSGVVTLNAYVPDIYLSDNGVPIENIARCEEVEGLMRDEVTAWKAGMSSYKFKLNTAIHTQRDEDIHQSFVVARLGFQILDS